MSDEPNFDRVARIYRWAEYLLLGTLLKTVREHFLPRLGETHRALVLGDGDGRFTKRLFASNRNVRVHAVDSSARMLVLLSERADAYRDRLNTLRGNALDAELPRDVDLVITHFFLDCLTQQEVEHLVARVSDNTARGTLWVVSDFAVPRGWLAFPSRIYIGVLYKAFQVLTKLRVQQLPDPQIALTRAGFARIERYERLGGLIYTELWKQE